MKFGNYIFPGVTILMFSVTSCQKDKSAVADKAIVDGNGIVGTWELCETSAALNPGVSKYAPGNGNILSFDGSNYERHANGQIVKSGQYTIVADSTVETSVCLVFPKGQFTNRIDYDNNTPVQKQFFEITGNQLTIFAGCYAYDAGHMAIYERIEGKGN